MALRVLFITNIVPPQMEGFAGLGTVMTGGWLHSVVDALSGREDVQLAVCVPTCSVDNTEKKLANGIACYAVHEKDKKKYDPLLGGRFEEVLADFAPDIVNVFGTEYPRTLSLLEVADPTRVVITITGLVSIYAERFMGSMPRRYSGFTIHRLLEPFTGILSLKGEQKDFIKRGRYEVEALSRAQHVIGRTRFDKSFTWSVNDKARYYHCGESLRDIFYKSDWNYDTCRRHSIIVPQAGYPIKGFEVVLEAARILKKKYGDLLIKVPGVSCLAKEKTFKSQLVTYLSEYPFYVQKKIEQYGLKENIEFIGLQDANNLCDHMLHSNVFVLPSAIENSPNTLGEAMLLGMPCIASCVGGVPDMMRDSIDGYLYPYNEPVTLAHLISNLFDDRELAEGFGVRAKIAAQRNHDKEANLQQLLSIYDSIVSENATKVD